MRLLSRRDFLRLAGGACAVLITGCASRPTPETPLPRPTASPGTGPTPGPTPRILRPEGVEPPPMKFTPLDTFYIQSYDTTPRVDPAAWRLRVEGLVERPLVLSLEEIRAMPAREFTWTLECISNPPGGNLIGNQRWRGTPLVPLLERAGIKAAATHVLWEAADGYTTALPLERVLHPDTMLAYEMAGRPLPPEHGFPLRVLIPGHYGQKMPKWLTRIVLLDHDVLGYWEQQGWDNMATIRVNSRIDVPSSGVEVPLGSALELEGVAMADESGVARVVVEVEDSEGRVLWVETVRTHGENPYTWVVWRTRWVPDRAGRYRVFARAWDGHGSTQERGTGGLLEGTFPRGTNYMHMVVVNVRA